MQKTILYIAISLDGFVAGIGVIIEGRATYELSVARGFCDYLGTSVAG